MGRTAKTVIETSEIDDIVTELNEGNVEQLFKECLSKPDSKDVVSASVASTITGFEQSDVKIIIFDKAALMANRKNIEYLYGQLKCVHSPARRIPLSDFFLSYLSYTWTSDQNTLMKLLYLGSVHEYRILANFEANDMTTSFVQDIRPTLSPKDPNFPAWWAAHKSEWEQ